MKTILITILITLSISLLANQTQIVLGTYSKQASAKEIQLQLNKIIEKNPKFKKILEKNNIKSVSKKFNKYYIVSLEPFFDKATQIAVLSELKKTEFNDAYVLEIVSDKKDTKKVIPKIEKESNLKDLSTQTKKLYVRDIPKNVVDIKSFAFISSKEAFYLLGNEKYGIMKKSFAFASKEVAQKYAEEYGGCIVDYETYVKMDDEAVKKYVKKHGIIIVKDTNTTKPTKKGNSKNNSTLNKYPKPAKKSNSPVDIYSKENLNKYQ